MALRSFLLQPLDHPQESLVVIFVLWKSVLLLIAACSPGPGYDTSTTLAQPYNELADLNFAVSLLRLFSTKLTRWDAIYFSTVARRDYLYEQEWAFGWGFTRLIKFFASDLREIGFHDYEFVESFVGVCLSHAAHGLSVLVLYHLALAILRNGIDRKFAFIAACLHIFSPAGLFLSAPYGESTFAFLSFSGYLLFVKGFNFKGQTKSYHDIMIITSGVVLGLATTVRGNGLLNCLLFLEEAVRALYILKDGLELHSTRRIIAAGIGGLCVISGFLVPQAIAFLEFCGNQIPDNQIPRVWCSRTLPSIFGFVQSHYWNVGFLRYWTLSNIPLFVLAFPMLSIMMVSSLVALQYPNNLASVMRQSTKGPLWKMEPRLLRSLAVPQLLLAILDLTSYHVQIITRISSGYCIWYFWLADALIGSVEVNPVPKANETGRRMVNGSSGLVMYIILYATIQGGLFSSFLPPA